MLFEDAVRALDRLPGLTAPLPGGPASLMPVFGGGLLRPRFGPSETARPAAVLVLVHPDPAGAARVVLTERLAYDGHHGGEVSFPGGKAEPGDLDAVATALREATEEVALDVRAAGIRIVGTLETVFIPVSDFRITPVVAVAPAAPALAANPAEVARILQPPLSAFLPGAPVEVVEREISDWSIRYGGYRIEGLHVWGATARILGQLGALVANPAT